KGAKQIGFTIVSLTVSLVAVLIPLLFMGGIIGRLFREFAVTLAVAIGVSAVLSLTLTAMMCAHVLKPHAEEKQTRFTRFTERQWERLARFYDGGLKWVLDHQRLTLAVTIATLLFTFLLALAVPKGFFPQQDTGLIIGVSESSPDASFTRMMDRQRALADAHSREVTQGGPKAGRKRRTLPQLRGVTSDLLASGLQETLIIDRDPGARLGILPQAIDDTLYDAFGERQVSTIFTQLNQYRVILEVRPQDQQDPRALDRIYLKSTNGEMVPLSAFARFEGGTSPLSVNHQGQ